MLVEAGAAVEATGAKSMYAHVFHACSVAIETLDPFILYFLPATARPSTTLRSGATLTSASFSWMPAL